MRQLKVSETTWHGIRLPKPIIAMTFLLRKKILQHALRIADCLVDLGIKGPSELIELGSGSGHLSAILAEKGYSTTLMDFSPKALQKSQDLFELKGLGGNFIAGDIFNVDHLLSKPYDVAWNSGVMEHFNESELRELFKKISTVIKNYYLCIVPNPQSLPYLLFRYKAMKQGHWLYGLEFLRNNYEQIAQSAGFELIKKNYVGKDFTSDYIRYFFGHEQQQAYQAFVESGFLPEKESYLILYVFQKKSSKNLRVSRHTSSCEAQTINFDYITHLQKNNRLLVEKYEQQACELNTLKHMHSTNLLTSKIRTITLPKRYLQLQSVYKRYGMFTLLGMVSQQVVRHGFLNALTYFKDKVMYPGNFCQTAEKPACAPKQAFNISAVSSAIDFIEFTHERGLLKGIIFIDSAFDFDENRNQRSIAMAKEFNALGYFVFFLRYQWRKNDNSYLDYNVFKQGIQQIPRGDFPQLIALQSLKKIKTNQYIITSIPDSFILENYLSIRQQGIKISYDIIDNWEAFHALGYAPWYCKKIERFFINNADVVSAVSNGLINAHNSTRHIELISNGLFGGLHFLSHAPTDNAHHVGYFGHLTEKWFNWDIVFKLADDKRFVVHIIGEGAPSWTLKKMLTYPNMPFYGYIPQQDLPQYAAHFSVGLIPFKDSALSQCVDPLKVYEYLQFGLPVVSTGIPHLSTYPYCINVPDFDAFKHAILELSQKPPMDKVLIASFLQGNAWKNKCTTLLNLLDKSHITGETACEN